MAYVFKSFFFQGSLTKKICHTQQILAVERVCVLGGRGMWVGSLCESIKKRKFVTKIFFSDMFRSSAVNSSFSLEICCKRKTLLSFYRFSFSRYLELAEHQFSSDRYFGCISRFGCCTDRIYYFFESIRISALFKWTLNFHTSP